MADKVDGEDSPPEDVSIHVTVGDLLQYIRGLPPDTEIYLESVYEMDEVSGAIYYPDQGVLSLVGSRTEVEIDEKDWPTAIIFGNPSVGGPGGPDEEQEFDNDIPFDVNTPPPAEEPEPETDTKAGEVDAPPRP